MGEWLQLTRLQAVHKAARAIKSGGFAHLIRIVERSRTGLRAAYERMANNADEHAQCPLIEVDRKWSARRQTGAFDPTQTPTAFLDGSPKLP
jgi:hypothetical protein